MGNAFELSIELQNMLIIRDENNSSPYCYKIVNLPGGYLASISTNESPTLFGPSYHN